jgi:DNA invertase Pin-like site-specific DNA recombinase
MIFGYARVSTGDQNLDLQIDQLREAGCSKIFSETISGAKAERKELRRLLDQVRSGDVIVIWKLDRLGRSLKNLVELVADLMERGVGLKSLNDPIDTTSPQGKLIFNIFASLAEFERDLIIERTQAGLKAARARGRNGGRPKGLSDDAKRKAVAAEALYREKQLSANEIANNLGISKATLYSYLRHRGVEVGSFTKSKKQTEPKALQVAMWLTVQNNNKHIRGRKQSLVEIETDILARYSMRQLSPNGHEYELMIPYEDDADLDETINDLIQDAANIADLRHCFIECEVTALDGSERRW